VQERDRGIFKIGREVEETGGGRVAAKRSDVFIRKGN